MKAKILINTKNVTYNGSVFNEDVRVTVTEKIHGTNCQIGYNPLLQDQPELFEDGKVIIISKGLGAKGLAFKDNETNSQNLYVRTYRQSLDVNGLTIGQRLKQLCESGEHSFLTPETPIYVVGEIIGPGVQDGFDYGFTRTEFRVFDVYIGMPKKGRYLHEFEKMIVIKQLGLTRVPVLYFGPWNPDLIKRYTSGKETVSGKELHMREGIVITPQLEYTNYDLGRVILKSVSEEYLTRKDGTEYN